MHKSSVKFFVEDFTQLVISMYTASRFAYRTADFSCTFGMRRGRELDARHRANCEPDRNAGTQSDGKWRYVRLHGLDLADLYAVRNAAARSGCFGDAGADIDAVGLDDVAKRYAGRYGFDRTIVRRTKRLDGVIGQRN